MRKALSLLLCAALLSTSGPLPVWAQQVHGAAAGLTAVPVGAPAGAAAALGARVAPVSGISIPLAGLPSSLPSLQGALPSILPLPKASSAFSVEGSAAQSRAAAASIPAQAAVPAEKPAEPRPAGKVLPFQRPAAAAEGSSAPAQARGARGTLEGVARTLPSSRERGGLSGLLGRLFDGLRRGKGSIADPVLAGGSAAPSNLRLLHPAAGGASVRSEVPAPKEAQEGTKKPLPLSYKLYLGGQILYALGQEASTLIAPLYAYFQQGLGFAVASQFVDLVCIIPGSMLGDWLVRRFDSKKVYLGGILVHAVAFLSVPAAFLLTGTFSPVHFMAFKVVSGLIYGALRGVAEKEIPSRILGQEDMERLKTAGSLFYAAFEVAELVAALATTALIAGLGLNGASLAMGVVMATSFIPNFFIRFREGAPVDEGGESGTEKKLPLAMYMPFVFSLLFHILLYGFFSPFFALELFHAEALNSRIIAFYTAGSLAVALLSAYFPKLTSRLSEKGWAVAGIAAALLFFWATLAFRIPALTMGLAFLLGVGLTEMQIQWRALYQKRLALEAQPKVFKWLSIAGILAAAVPAAIMQAGVLAKVSMPLLLGVVGAGITAAAVGIPLALKLLKKFRKQSG